MSAAAATELTSVARSTSLPMFFDNLDSFVEAPEGVAKLRELILDLAVRGKLVEQDENDEPASELLEALDSEKARLVKAKVIKRSEPAPLVEVDDQPFSVPESWEFTRLDRVCSLVTDGEQETFKTSPISQS